MIDPIEDEDLAFIMEAEEVIRGSQPDSVEFSGELSPFDKRVYEAVCHLYSIGNRIITWQQLHNAMGGCDMASEEVLSTLKESIRNIGSVSLIKSYANIPSSGNVYQCKGMLLNATTLETIVAGVHIDLFQLVCEPFVDSSALK